MLKCVFDCAKLLTKVTFRVTIFKFGYLLLRWYIGMGILGGHVHLGELAVAGVHRCIVSEDVAGDSGIGRGNAKHAERSWERGGPKVSVFESR